MFYMKKIVMASVAVLGMLVLGGSVVVPAFALENSVDMIDVQVQAQKPVEFNNSNFETGTYRIKLDNMDEPGFFNIYDNKGALLESLTLVEDTYGYLYINGDALDNVCQFQNVVYDRISELDLGYSGYQVYSFDDLGRDYDPILYGEKDEVVVDVEDQENIESEKDFVDPVASYGEVIDGVVYVDMGALTEEDLVAMFS